MSPPPCRAGDADGDRSGCPGTGQQPGNPARAAAAILTAPDADEPPLRLPLGNDTTSAVIGHLDRARTELHSWGQLTRSTDFDE
ncbi:MULTISPECIES: hypothetical protein [Streptomyces]|jgi:hypothetical protein|uniref:hypothetical protein n=1 Tax=Streptomyces TaxID=1883 RepID=UPI00380F4D10